MPDVLAMALKAHRRALMERQLNGFEDGWVFPSDSGFAVFLSSGGAAIRSFCGLAHGPRELA